MIPFQTLNRTAIASIVDIQMERVSRQLAAHGIELRLTDEARRQLAHEGYDPVFGARPLKRVIQQRLQNAIATGVLERQYVAPTIIEIGWENGAFVFQSSREPAAAAVP